MPTTAEAGPGESKEPGTLSGSPRGRPKYPERPVPEAGSEWRRDSIPDTLTVAGYSRGRSQAEA